MCAAAAGVTEGGADRGLLDSNLLISGAHQKATSTAALSEVRHQLTGAIVQEKRKTYSLARETLQTRRQHSTVSENHLKSPI